MPLRVTPADVKQLQHLLSSLPAEGVDDLAASARQVTYRAGEAVMGEREPWTPSVVTDGTLRLTIRARDGREATLRVFGRGVMLGLVALFEPDYSNSLHERSVVALERSTVVFFDPAAFLRVCHRHPAFTLDALRLTTQWGGALTDSAAQFAFMSVRQRVAAQLLRLAVRDYQGRLVVAATQQQLANAVGSVREVVARTLHELRADGLINLSRAKVIVLDSGQLAQEAYRAT